ncbi:MAG: hypothetical protein WAX14_00645 [Rhodococcus sp. (in: high G+C Gram-positive bacteria)]|uniref:hypothetical protein n=1 Tax=Rhodococcus sp. TaxID=1831 RepID=UPI003BB7AF5A
MKVDPEMLAALATTLMDYADDVRTAGNTHHTGPWNDLGVLAHSLPGSQLDAVSSTAIATLTGAFDVLAGPIDQMAYIAGSGAKNYVITDDEFTARIRNTGETA